MRFAIRSLAIAAALLAVFVTTLPAQHGHHSSAITADLKSDVEQVEKKLLDLARAIPEDKYPWTPGAGVRSIREVVLHVAADNYLIPAALGFPADASTGIKGEDYKTALAYEKRAMNKADAIAALERSFAFLKKSMTDMPAARWGQKGKLFGMDFTGQQAWIMAATHLHEHLGQLIAYARMNGVAPPWS